MKHYLFTSLITALITGLVQAQSGWLDTTFNSSGIVISSSQGSENGGEAIAIQSDGKIVVAGVNNPGSGNDIQLLRYLTNGSLDATFGNAGITLTDIAPTDDPVDIKIQNDGKIIVLTESHLIRYNTNGSLDLTFNSVGWLALNNMVGNGTALGIQSSGKIVASFMTYDAVNFETLLNLNLYNTDGSLSSNTNLGFYSGNVVDLVVQSNDSIVVLGQDGYSYAFGFDNNGAINTSYGNSGSNHFSWSIMAWEKATIQSDDKVIACNIEGDLYRITTAGLLDNTFGTGGVVSTGINPSQSSINIDMAIQDDGKIVITEDLDNDYRIRRFFNNGEIDTTFSIDGVVTLDVTGLVDKTAHFDIQTDGKYVITGTASDDFGTIRLNNTCSPVTSTNSINACGQSSYTWIDGITYTSNNNIATYTFVEGASNGCDSIVTLDLTINPVSDITTTVNGTTISANNTAASYQWLDCDNNNSIIIDETGQSFTPSASGNYAVELTENGCVDTSACSSISIVGILENSFGNDLLIYPNPTSGNLSIDLGFSYENSQVLITDIYGKLITSKNVSQTQFLNLFIQKPAGIYLVTIQASDKKAVIRLIKE